MKLYKGGDFYKSREWFRSLRSLNHNQGKMDKNEGKMDGNQDKMSPN